MLTMPRDPPKLHRSTQIQTIDRKYGIFGPASHAMNSRVTQLKHKSAPDGYRVTSRADYVKQLENKEEARRRAAQQMLDMKRTRFLKKHTRGYDPKKNEDLPEKLKRQRDMAYPVEKYDGAQDAYESMYAQHFGGDKYYEHPRHLGGAARFYREYRV